MAFIVINGEEKGPVVGVYETVERATEAAEANAQWSHVVDAVDNRVDVGWYYDSGEVLDQPYPKWVSRQLVILESLRRLESTPAIGVWADTDNAKAKNVIRWVEMMARAAAVEGNLTDDDRHAILQNELKTKARDFFINHDGTAWSGYLPDDRAGWAWRSLLPDGSGSEAPVSPISSQPVTDMALNLENDFNWIEFLGN